MKNKLLNPVYDYDEDDSLGYVLGDPDLSEELRRILYDHATKKFGELEGGFEGIKILTRDEADEAYLDLRRTFDPLIRGKNKAQKIFNFIINNEAGEPFDNLESLNDFLSDKPINAYVLMKLLSLLLANEMKYKASLAAQVRHVETYELKRQAIDFWVKNIDPKLSNEKAADMLVKIVPVSHRKLSQYIAEAKKQNILSASKV